MNPQKKGFSQELITCKVLGKIVDRFMDFCTSYTEFFNVYRYNNVSEHAKNYLAGLLMKSPRKNMERINEYVDGGNYQSYQNFISDSSWDHYALNNQICSDANALLGSSESVLCIDESCFSKKGKLSVGVSRQWNGRLGKIDNCQVGVFASLCNSTGSTLLDYRLYLPQEWIDDPQRCKKAGIPEQHRVFKTKLEFAYEMIESAISRGVDFGWVAADAFYGRDSKLLNKLDDCKIKFLADIPSTHTVYLDDPDPYMPRRRNKIGPKYKNLHARTEAVSVHTLFEQLNAKQWSTVTVRNTTKGVLKTKAYRRAVYTWDGEEKKARRWWLVMLFDPKTKEKKWFFSNAEISITLKTLVRRHACRYWIERTFQDGKTSVGMADYQVRGWLAWHHHMTMVMLALLFMVKERIINKKQFDLLSCQDIIELLNYYLPRKDRTEKAILMNMIQRHKQRKQSIESAFRKQKMKECIATK
jgi:SRSO17 transposase